jgi:hypothetical protein
MKPIPEIKEADTTNVNIRDAVNNKGGAPRLPNERDEVPDDRVIDREHMKDPGNKTPSRDKTDT